MEQNNNVIKIRRFQPEDVDQLVDIFIDIYSKMPWNELWKRSFVKQRISDLTINPVAKAYVICDEKGLISGGLFGRRNIFIDAVELFIDEFFIAPKSQRKGYGSKLIKYVAEELSKEGYSYLVLNTDRGYPSEKFFNKNSFKYQYSCIFMYKNIIQE